VGAAVLPLAGCASMEAKASLGDRPALMVPLAPAHVIEAAPEPEPEPEPVSELPPTPPPPSRTARPTPRPAAPQPADPKPVEQPPTEPPVAAPPPATPPAQLRTPQTADTSSAAKAARTTIENAKSILNGVNYGPLSNERKKAYDQVKLFLTQAEEALKEGNLVFAQANANKAETLAKELAGR
jgi:outer membrane biosynthesis protein TonB